MKIESELKVGAKKGVHNSERKSYFYLREDRWYMPSSLPSYYKIKLDRSATINTAADKPYVYFD